MNNLFGLTRLFAVAFALIFGMAANTQSLAGTPDGQTPANEGVCDGLKGATPGLYGLCVAYCEAQDLDSFDKEPPNTRILDNYRKKMQAGDPDMPCLQVPCPCWSDAELASITPASCNRDAEFAQVRDAFAVLKSADATIAPDRERCSYIDSDTNTIRSFGITPTEAAICFEQVNAVCDAAGL